MLNIILIAFIHHTNEAFFPIAMGLLSAYGLYQKIAAGNALDNLEGQPRPQYESPQSLNQKAQAMTTGFTPDEKAAFYASQARQNNQQYQQSINRNPTIAGNINSAINYGNIGADLNFASADAKRRFENYNSALGLVRGQSNMQTNSDLNYRLMREKALGAASQSGAQNIFSGLEGIGNEQLAQQIYGDHKAGLSPAVTPADTSPYNSYSSLMNYQQRRNGAPYSQSNDPYGIY